MGLCCPDFRGVTAVIYDISYYLVILSIFLDRLIDGLYFLLTNLRDLQRFVYLVLLILEDTLLDEIIGATKVRNWKLGEINLRIFFKEIEFQLH